MTGFVVQGHIYTVKKKKQSYLFLQINSSHSNHIQPCDPAIKKIKKNNYLILKMYNLEYTVHKI